MIEYRKIISNTIAEDALNKLGSEGWDMCGVSGNVMYFKRAIDPLAKINEPMRSIGKTIHPSPARGKK